MTRIEIIITECICVRASVCAINPLYFFSSSGLIQ